MIRVLLADDEHLVRSGLRSILESSPDIVVVAEARNGAEAVGAVRRLDLDVVLMDVRMPVIDGLEALEQVTALPGAPAVVMLTTFDLDEYVHRALRMRAAGFMLKESPPRDLVAAVRTAVEGNAMLAPSVTRRLIDTFAERRPSAASGARESLEVLTPRELQVARGVAEGLSNGQISRRLQMQETTVKTHVSRAMAKLNLQNRVQIALLLVEAGVDTQDD
jgi:DNA-binding NarL/FixJ family response regulator